MRGTKAKAMRRYVRERFPFLSATTLYRKGLHGFSQAVVAPECQRAVYLKTKSAYKRARIKDTDAWRRYVRTKHSSTNAGPSCI